tara:strand:- start:319 stop:624 length:306 start_codon:yes stop_codon:yes gene_type:complete
MADLSGNSNTIEITSNITEQVANLEAKKLAWLEDKAEVLLNSENKKELVVGLIADFNNILNNSKMIEKIAKDGSKKDTIIELRSVLVEIANLFDPEWRYQV